MSLQIWTREAMTAILQERLAMEQEYTAGTLRAGCGPRWLVDLIPRAVDPFIRAHPIRVNILAGRTAALREQLETGRISLMFGTIDNVRLFSHHSVFEMSADCFAIVACNTHPLHARKTLSIAELSSER